MKLTLTLDTATSIALRRLAHELRCSEEEAAIRALRDALVGMGMLEISLQQKERGSTESET